MSELVQSLLSLTRMQQGTDRYPMRRADLSEFVNACCDEFIPADGRGIRLYRDIEPGVEADYNHALMSRVVQNLLQNAYKYGREGRADRRRAARAGRQRRADRRRRRHRHRKGRP